MSYRDALERREILERHWPYFFDLCGWCGSYENEEHDEQCDWVKIRSQHHLEVAA